MSWQTRHRQDLTDFPVEQMDSIQFRIHCYSIAKTHYSVKGFEPMCEGVQWNSPYYVFFHTLSSHFHCTGKAGGFGPELSHVSKESHIFIMLDVMKTNSVTDALTVFLHAKQDKRNRKYFSYIYGQILLFLEDIYMTFCLMCPPFL